MKHDTSLIGPHLQHPTVPHHDQTPPALGNCTDWHRLPILRWCSRPVRRSLALLSVPEEIASRQKSVVAARCQVAGLGVEVEKPVLLPLRPRSRRWPRVRSPQTSGWRSGVCRGLLHWTLLSPLAEFARSSQAAVEAYEARKRDHQLLQHHCCPEGLQFFPLVAEACSGGWGTHCRFHVACTRWPPCSMLW